MKLTKENFNLIFNYIDEQVNDDVHGQFDEKSDFFPKWGGVNLKVHIVVIEFLTDWKEAKIYRLTEFWQNHKLLNK